jgi:hypothetical protein
LRSRAPDRCEAHREQHAGLIETDATVTRGSGLRELAQNHDLGERRQRAALPDVAAGAQVLDDFRLEVKRQTFVAARMLVRADELVTGKAEQHRARDHLEMPTANAIAEGAVADVRQRVALMLLRERRIARPGGASIVDDRNGSAVQGGCREHRGHGRPSSRGQQELRRIGT